jgi:hypothetical protein
VKIHIILWDMTLCCNVVSGYQHFRETYAAFFQEKNKTAWDLAVYMQMEAKDTGQEG